MLDCTSAHRSNLTDHENSGARVGRTSESLEAASRQTERSPPAVFGSTLTAEVVAEVTSTRTAPTAEFPLPNQLLPLLLASTAAKLERETSCIRHTSADASSDFFSGAYWNPQHRRLKPCCLPAPAAALPQSTLPAANDQVGSIHNFIRRLSLTRSDSFTQHKWPETGACR
eukprot:6199580-Pleurochrysis_carterae.AAC.2